MEWFCLGSFQFSWPTEHQRENKAGNHPSSETQMENVDDSRGHFILSRNPSFQKTIRTPGKQLFFFFLKKKKHGLKEWGESTPRIIASPGKLLTNVTTRL